MSGSKLIHKPCCEEVMKGSQIDEWSGLILGLHPANERHCYKVTPSLIGSRWWSSRPKGTIATLQCSRDVPQYVTSHCISIRGLDQYNKYLISTVNMQNYFEVYKSCIRISYHILYCVQQKKTKFTTEQPYMLPILYCQYHPCWGQGISRFGIWPQIQNIPSPTSAELTSTGLHNCQ